MFLFFGKLTLKKTLLVVYTYKQHTENTCPWSYTMDMMDNKYLKIESKMLHFD